MANREAYQKLRHAANERIRRLSKAGIESSYKPPKSKTLTDKEIEREYNKLVQWMSKSTNTVKGAKAAAAERAAALEARKERKRERERERYQERRKAAGQEYKPRPPKLSEEERRERRREQRRRAREKSDIQKNLDRLKSEDRQKYNALNNLKSGLKKYGIDVTSFQQLEAWGEYIKERNEDKNKDFYLFDIWIDQMRDATNKHEETITARDINRVMQNFAEWQSNLDALSDEYIRERIPGELSFDVFGTIWNAYMNVAHNYFESE